MHRRARSTCRCRRAGLSLMELLLVVTILGIVASVVIPRLQTSAVSAKQVTDDQNRAEINGAVNRWYLEKGTWPKTDLTDIGTDPNFFPSGIPVNPATGALYSLDPGTHRVK